MKNRIPHLVWNVIALFWFQTALMNTIISTIAAATLDMATIYA
jgi:hypothetical protein